MRIVRERGCQVAQVARLDVDRWATAWAATSVAPGGGRRPVSPLHDRLSQRVPVPRLFHRLRRLPPTPTTRRSDCLLSSPGLWRTRKGHSTSVQAPEDSLPAHTSLTRLGSLAFPRSPLLHISRSLSTSSWFATLTGALQSPARTTTCICIYIHRGNEITRGTRGWKKKEKKKMYGCISRVQSCGVPTSDVDRACPVIIGCDRVLVSSRGCWSRLRSCSRRGNFLSNNLLR